ncbi:MAG: insulinase family protein [Angelakisella sp.]
MINIIEWGDITMSEKKLVREQLSEGVTFSSVRDEKFRHNSVSIHMIAELSPEKAAATAILPYLLRKGSSHYPDFTLLEQQLCELYGASLSSDIVRYGQYHIVSCGITFIDDSYTLDKEVISDRCADLLGDMVLSPKITAGAFDAEDFKLEQQNLIDTIEAEINDKRTYAINRCRTMMLEGTVLATPKYGTVEAARALTPEAAAERYSELVDTAQVEIIFVGCGDPTAAKEKFRGLFAGRTRHPVKVPSQAVTERAGILKELTQEMEVAQGKLCIGMRTGKLASKADVDATKVMAALYGGTTTSRLFLNVREKLSLCYYCAARFDRATGILMVDSGVEKQNKDKAQTAILEQLSILAKGDFTADELTETKLACINGIRSTKDSLSATESWYLVQILEGTDYSPDDEVAAMEAVTMEAVTAAAARVTTDSIYFLCGNKEASKDEE